MSQDFVLVLIHFSVFGMLNIVIKTQKVLSSMGEGLETGLLC